MEVTNHLKIELLKTMLRIRLFEMAVSECNQRADIVGACHIYVGEEAVAAGVCAALKPEDYITSTHRGHGHCIAKGADLKRLMAELWARETGYCRGRGGSMHIYIKELNVLGTNGIFGGGLPLSVGAALHAKMSKSRQVCACFFGDGAANNATFHESINLAAVQNLPVIFVCENNLYATVTAVHEATKTRNFADRAAAYVIPGVVVDGNDVLDVLEKTDKAVTRARNDEGPTLVECKTYRRFGHYVGEPDKTYRSQEEKDEWRKKDPIEMFCKHLETNGIINTEGIKAIEKEAETEVGEAVEFAKNSPLPNPDTVTHYVWSEEV